MREILFRGKSKNGEWAYGCLFVLGKGTEYEDVYILGDLDHRETVYDIWKCAERVDPKTVGQFTGLTDKNGEKIFEGDVGDTRRWHVAYAADVGASYGMTAGWYIQRDDFESWSELECADNYEVLGNIHDNPELLEVK